MFFIKIDFLLRKNSNFAKKVDKYSQKNNRYNIPEIVRFYGIVIKMFFKPKEQETSHIHAIYNEYVGLFNISTFEMF